MRSKLVPKSWQRPIVRVTQPSILGGTSDPEIVAQRNKEAWDRTTERILKRCRTDENYRRDLLQRIEVAGRDKRGKVRVIPDWLPAFVFKAIQDTQARFIMRATGRPPSVDDVCTLLLERVFEPHLKAGTLRNQYFKEKRRRQL